MTVVNQHNENHHREGYWEDYYNNGKISYTGYYKNGIKDDYWKFYKADGYLIMTGKFIGGKRDGLWKFYVNGELDEKYFYF